MRVQNLYATSPLPAGICLAAAMHIGPAALAQAPPDTITLMAVVRDFIERDEPGGHPDFEREDDADGFTVFAVAETIGSDGKPVWRSQGKRVKKNPYVQWEDSMGRNICHYLHGPGDGQAGKTDTGMEPNFTTKANFDLWYRDVPGVNISTIIELTLVRQADDTYVFDSDVDPFYKSKGGFFPIDDQLFGNSEANDSHNYHFTTEIHTSFKYDASAGQLFKFDGDDDVFVFINGQLVVDLGGTHGSAGSQYVDLNRLGLTDGDTYPLDLFNAERMTNGSNYAFQTNLILEDRLISTITAAFD